MKSIFIVIVAIIFLPTLGHAEPVYLDCVRSGGEHFFVKVDESSGKITHTEVNTQNSYNVEGFFAPNMISYKFTWGEVLISYQKYQINRTTLQFGSSLQLTFARKYRNNSHSGSEPIIGKGQCEIRKVEERKF